MLYSILKLIIGAGLHLHFRRIETNGLEQLEEKKPAIIIANHTNALTDPLLLGILLKRRIHFYVRGDVFENRLARALFTKLGMLPIYRSQEGRENLSRNEESNQGALQILQEGGALLIFAEGSSDEHKVLRAAKKGPFRLAAAAAQLLPEPPAIIPLGINYLEPEKPDTTAWLLSGPALSWPEGWQQLPEAQLSLKLMKAADRSFAPLVLHAGSIMRAEIAETLLLLQKNCLGTKQQTAGYFNFHVAKKTTDRLAALSEQDFQQLCLTATKYQQALKELGLSEKAFKNVAPATLWMSTFAALPLWLTSVVFHGPVFAVANRIVQGKVSTKDFISSIHVLSVTFLNIIWYLLWLLVLSFLWGGTTALLLLLALAACGIITHTLLLPIVSQWREQRRLLLVRKKRKEPYDKLLSLRHELIAWLHAAD